MRLSIGARLIDAAHPLLVAEMASAHEGRLDEALAIVRAVAVAGGEAIKFQLVVADELVTASHPQAALFRRMAMDRQQWQAVVETVQRLGVIPMADLFGARSLQWAQALDIPVYKIPSASLTDPWLVPQVAALHRLTLLSTAGATEEELAWVVEQFRRAGHEAFVLMHGFQAFPTPLEATHLRRLVWLRERFGCAVGLSDHVAGDSPMARQVPLMGRALGAVVIEKHVTLDRSRRGLDWESALEPAEFGELQRAIHEGGVTLGLPDGAWAAGEAVYRQRMRRHLVARRQLDAGEIITAEKLECRRVIAEDAIDPWFLQPQAGRPVIGQKLRRALAQGKALTWEALADPVVAVCIAVRLKSERLPRKALANLGGRLAIERLIERLQTSRRVHRIVLCTSTLPEDQRLVDVARRLDIDWVCGDPEDVMARFLQAADQVQADLIVRVTGDNPLTDPDTMDRMIADHLAHDAEYTYTEELPVGTRPEIIAVPALRRLAALAEDPSQTEYLTLYLQQPSAVRGHRYVIHDPQLQRPGYRLTLDTPEDLALLQAIYERLGGRSAVALNEVIRLLDATPALVALNASVVQRDPAAQINTRLRDPATAKTR